MLQFDPQTLTRMDYVVTKSSSFVIMESKALSRSLEFHRELCSILCNNLNRKIIWKIIDTCVCILESLCCTLETNITTKRKGEDDEEASGFFSIRGFFFIRNEYSHFISLALNDFSCVYPVSTLSLWASTSMPNPHCSIQPPLIFHVTTPNTMSSVPMSGSEPLWFPKWHLVKLLNYSLRGTNRLLHCSQVTCSFCRGFQWPCLLLYRLSFSLSLKPSTIFVASSGKYIF